MYPRFYLNIRTLFAVGQISSTSLQQDLKYFLRNDSAIHSASSSWFLLISAKVETKLTREVTKKGQLQTLLRKPYFLFIT